MIHRGYRYELKPTAAQAETLGQWIGSVRFVFNICLEQRRDFWRQFRRATGRPLTWVEQCRQVTELRAQVDWIEAVPRNALDRAARDLDAAFAAFFSGRAGYPRPRQKGLNDTLRLRGVDVSFRKLNAKWSAIRLPKIGWVKYRDTRPLAGRPLSVTVGLKAGRWSLAVAQELEQGETAALPASVGIDRGVAQTLTLSTGEVMQAPSLKRVEALKRRAQKRLARRRKGSARRTSARVKVARLSARKAAMLNDWSHKASTDIARRFGLVAIESLNIQNMTASGSHKRGLNRSILEQAWGRFASHLDYKLSERGGVLISVPAAYTSQTCAGCGVVDARSRQSQAVFVCIHCGHTDNADVNAAREILRRSTSGQGAEGSHWRPVEASIMAAA